MGGLLLRRILLRSRDNERQLATKVIIRSSHCLTQTQMICIDDTFNEYQASNK